MNLIQNSKKYIFYMNPEHVGLQALHLEAAELHTRKIKKFYSWNYI